MKIRLNQNAVKTSVEIDPVNEGNSRQFAPLIAVTVFHVGKAVGDTAPKVVSAYAGQLTANDAAIYAEGLHLAAFICDQAKKSNDLVKAFEHLKGQGLPTMQGIYEQAGMVEACKCEGCQAAKQAAVVH